jgi:non-ribosomal peptide synthetase component F
VRQTTLEAYAHQDVPFEKLVEELEPARDLSQNPLFQVAFAVQNAPMPELTLPGVRLTPGAGTVTRTRFDLEWHVWPYGDSLQLSVIYNTDLFEAATIARMVGHYQHLLEAIVTDPSQRVSELPLLSAAERQQVLVQWNATQGAYPRGQCLSALFEAQVQRTPEAVAVVMGEEQLSYAALNRRANQLAHHLRALGVGPEARVGFLWSAAALVVGLLGIAKAGGAYVPLDPSYPAARLAFMLQDAGVSVLLSEPGVGDALPPYHGPTVWLEPAAALLACQATTNPTRVSQPENTVYVMYTSGSTGEPKGIGITHPAIVRLVCATNYIAIAADEVVAQASNAAFDALTFEVWGALLRDPRWAWRARVVLAPQGLAAAVGQHGITTLFLTTALFNQIAAEAPAALGQCGRCCLGASGGCGGGAPGGGGGPPQRLLRVWADREHDVCELAGGAGGGGRGGHSAHWAGGGEHHAARARRARGAGAGGRAGRGSILAGTAARAIMSAQG